MGSFAQGGLIEGNATTATSGGTLTLVALSKTVQRLTGTSDHTVVLPDATTMRKGRIFVVDNESTGVITVNDNNGAKVALVAGRSFREFKLIDNGFTEGTWATSTPAETNYPLKLSESSPPDSKLQISSNRVRQHDGSLLTLAVLDNVYTLFPHTTIDFQTGATTGGVVELDGAALVLPSSVLGEYRRFALTYDHINNKILVAYSASSATLGGLTAPATLFRGVPGIPLGFLDLEGNNTVTPGTYISPGATTTVITNHVGTTNCIHRFEQQRRHTGPVSVPLSWNAPAPGGPVLDEEFSQKVYLFDDGVDLELWADIKVPTSYVVGTPITLLAGWYTPAAGGDTVRLQSTAYLVRKDVDSYGDTSNFHNSTNAAVANTVTNALREVELGLTDSSGKINSVAVSVGDVIRVKLTRDYATDTDPGSVRFLPAHSEVQF
jgi:hypothetical protein